MSRSNINGVAGALIAVALLVAATAAVAQSPEEIRAALSEAHARYKDLQEGKNADYIPALGRVDPKLYGIALVTTDGQVHAVGDAGTRFSIQSVSKVFTMARVMQDSGPDTIRTKVGVDATGQRFNSIMAIEMNAQRAINPLVNPGAIAATSLIGGTTPDAKWAKIIGTLNDFAGTTLNVDQEIYQSESETNQRNQAIARLLLAYERIYDEPATAVDLYTRQCSVAVSAKDLAVMAATLANGGRNPITKKQVLDEALVAKVLAVMTTAGLYDSSGTWLWTVGLPAKSGVGGGIIAVAPGKFGIAAFSPPVDEAGNSVRAQKAIAYVADKLKANLYASRPK
jgi:glutaminase